MADDFWVEYNKLDMANEGLLSEVVKMDGIMEDLTATLRRIGEASGGKATPLWEEHQNKWNRAYVEMRHQLNQHVLSSINIRDNFNDGDLQGANAMS
jgi:uncharacterized protein YukE